MTGILPLAFGAPWVLLGLLSLPAIWWLLQVTPPAPQRMRFPAIRLLLNAETQEESPAHTPWWVLALRLLLAAMVILALSQPVWNAEQTAPASGTRVFVVDNTWAAAPAWEARTETLRTLIDGAANSGDAVVLVPTAPRRAPRAPELLRPADAREQVAAMQPQPFLAAHSALLPALDEVEELLRGVPAQVHWLSDGLESEGRIALLYRLTALGEVTVHAPVDGAAVALLPPATDQDGFTLTLRRSAASPLAGLGEVRALGSNGRTLATAPFAFENGMAETTTDLVLPLEFRNEVTRIEINGVRSAGAVALVDETARRRAVGLVSGASTYDDQPLLSDLFYLERALEPYADLREGAIDDLISSGIDVLVLADVGQLAGAEYESVRAFVDEGGVLIRFAGPRLASQADDLLPVRLRAGDRALGGSLAWETPQGLMAFDDTSPFAGLDVAGDVQIGHQVLAEPEVVLAAKTWARLSDGTPLVTGDQLGEGWLVLFHVTANQDWSNLAASGMYVEMLQRLLRLSSGANPSSGAYQSDAPLPPLAVIDGFGRLGTPPPTAEPIRASETRTLIPDPQHPPGLYGTDAAATAINTVRAETNLRAATDWPATASVIGYARGAAISLQPPLLAIAIVLFLVDVLAALALAGHLRLPRGLAQGSGAAALAFLIATGTPDHAQAQYESESGTLSAEDLWLMEAVNELHLAYVITGNAASDDMARAGLAGLTRALFARTTVEPSDPMGVDIMEHELSVSPFLYWRIPPGQPPLTNAERERLANYMRNGGTLFVDTADADTPRVAGSGADLRSILRGLDVPPLAPVPEGHVLTRAFYLLDHFPGRYAAGDVWVEVPGEDGLTSTDRDGVSPIIIGANDFAAAWATDETGRPLATVTPGGDRQREMATRFGINLVMYVLTGNYKSDQVHVPALLERLDD